MRKMAALQLPCSSDSFDTAAPSCHLCSVCLRPMPTRNDGTIRVHGPHSHRCLGSGKPPSHPSARLTPSVSCISNSDSVRRPNSSLDENNIQRIPSVSTSSPLTVEHVQRFPEDRASDYLDPGGSYHSFVDDMMSQAFGAPLIRSDHDGTNCENIWFKHWSRIVAVRSRHYDLPGGSVGREFVTLLSDEVALVSNGSFISERLIVLLEVILQRDTMVVKGTDIRRLLKRRMEMWRLEHYDELLFEFERCAKKWASSRNKQPCPNHIVQVFSRLMLRGQVRSAVRWLTERMNDGGVLDPSQLVNDGSKRVFDVLREKHPDPANSGMQAFLPCHHLSPLTDVDVTGSHIEHACGKVYPRWCWSWRFQCSAMAGLSFEAWITQCTIA